MPRLFTLGKLIAPAFSVIVFDEKAFALLPRTRTPLPDLVRVEPVSAPLAVIVLPLPMAPATVTIASPVPVAPKLIGVVMVAENAGVAVPWIEARRRW